MENSEKKLTPIDFRKQITSSFHLKLIETLHEEWGVSRTDCVWIIFLQAMANERKKMIEESSPLSLKNFTDSLKKK